MFQWEMRARNGRKSSIPEATELNKRSGKEPFKKWENLAEDFPKHSVETSSNLYSLCFSLVERYRRDDLCIYLHLFFADHRKRSDLCIVVKSTDSAGREVLFADGDNLDFARSGSEICDEQPSVLIGVRELIQNPKSG